MTLDRFNGALNPTDDRVVEVTLAPGPDGIRRLRLARWQAHQGLWIHAWTGRPMLEAVSGWREKPMCGRMP